MNKLVIQTHKFERAKNQLKEFSLTKPEELALREVEVNGGLFNWFSHKVTGAELNELTKQIQGYLVKFNTLNTRFIKEFGEVYNALEALDKEYIQAILISIKAAEKASNEAKDAQKDINKTIEVQRQTITVLKKFKEKLDTYEHLENVDELWKDIQRFDNELKSIYEQIISLKQSSEEQSNSILQLNKFMDELSKSKHLSNIDVLWEDAQVFKHKLVTINEQLINSKNLIESQRRAIDTLENYKNELNELNHLFDIDQIWENVEKSKTEAKLLKVEVDELEQRLYKTKQQMDEDKISYESQMITMFKKIKIAYVLAGSSIGIALLQFVLSIMGIL